MESVFIVCSKDQLEVMFLNFTITACCIFFQICPLQGLFLRPPDGILRARSIEPGAIQSFSNEGYSSLVIPLDKVSNLSSFVMKITF